MKTRVFFGAGWITSLIYRWISDRMIWVFGEHEIWYARRVGVVMAGEPMPGL
jgi:hypothetical protein